MKKLQILLTGILSAWAGSANAGVISVNFHQWVNDAQMIDAGEVYGIATEGSEVAGWVNIQGKDTDPIVVTRDNLPLQNGISTTVDLSFSAPNSVASFNAAYSNTPMQAGLDDYTGTVTPTSATLSNLNAAFPEGYKVIVYFSGFNGNTGSSISDGTTTFYYQTLAAPAGFTTPVQTTDTSDDGDGTAPEAQYAVFGSNVAPLTSDSITLTLDTLYGGASALTGIQVVGPVAVPLAISYDGAAAPQLSLDGLAYWAYKIKVSENLTLGSWTTPSWGNVPAPASDSTVTVDDIDAPLPDARFYVAAEVWAP